MADFRLKEYEKVMRFSRRHKRKNNSTRADSADKYMPDTAEGITLSYQLKPDLLRTKLEIKIHH